jgi:signal transduction histidine kinase
MSSRLSSELLQLDQALDRLHQQLLSASRGGDADALLQSVTQLALHVERVVSHPSSIAAAKGSHSHQSALATIAHRLRTLCALADELELMHRQRLNVLQAHASNASSQVYGSRGLMSSSLTGGRSSFTA